jgi:hypothetical protein
VEKKDKRVTRKRQERRYTRGEEPIPIPASSEERENVKKKEKKKEMRGVLTNRLDPWFSTALFAHTATL